MLRIKLVINQEFTLETLALVNIEADRSTIREGLIPTKYYEKTTHALSTANDHYLKIRYKLSNVVVCIEDICIYMIFILVQDASTIGILGNSFTTLIEPFTIDDVGIHTKFKSNEVTFKLESPKRQSLIFSLKEWSVRNTSQINFLKK